jgi:ParB-like chromosome segregation protein Spo0J
VTNVLFDSEVTDEDEEVATARDTRVEAILERWGLSFQLVDEFPLRRLKIADETQARMAEHRQPTASVDEYAVHMKGGAIFPPILVASNGMLIDGNTRSAAAERIGRDTLPAYVVKLGNLEIGALIAAAINQTNGRRLASDELVAAAEGYLDAGYTEEAVARELGCSLSHVRNVRRERTFRDAAARVGVDGLKVGKPQQRTLAGINHDEPFRAAVELVSEANPTGKDTAALVEELTKARSDADAVAIVNAKRAEWAPAGPPPRRASSGAKPMKALKVVKSLVELINGAPEAVVSAGDDRATHAAAWRDLEPLVVRVVALYSMEAPATDG